MFNLWVVITGTPPAKGARQSAPAVLSPSKEPNNEQLLERLKDDILSKGQCQEIHAWAALMPLLWGS